MECVFIACIPINFVHLKRLFAPQLILLFIHYIVRVVFEIIDALNLTLIYGC